MKREEIIKLAREAGLPSSELYHGNLERFAALVAAHVRETEFKPDWNKYQQGLADGAAAERAEVERLKLLCEEMLRELYVYRASEYLKDVTASIRARIKK